MINKLLDTNPVTSIIAVIVVIVGAVIAIIHPDVLSFGDYCKDIGFSTAGLGVWGVARSMAGKGKK